tara:strand:+ start:1603 stop:2808 length:1206 start_codon:yes stop_codon:yes gene_type:complete
MAINFPDSPNVNDVHTESSLGKTWRWDGTSWKIYTTSTSGIGLSDLSVSQQAVGTAALTYSNTTGVFTYTPPDLSTGTSRYTLPIASTTVLGGIKVGSNLTIDANGVLAGVSSYTLPTATTTVLGGVKIDGTTITISNGVISGAPSVPTTITVADESADTSCYPLFATSDVGDLEPKTGTNFLFNSSSGQIEAGGFKKTGGSSSEFLKADGSIDSNSYATATSGFPTGGIIMWSGSIANIPSGWALCDGQNSTPDLRDRFIVGAGSGAGSNYNVASIGGSTDAVVVEHNHANGSLGTNSTGSHSHTVSASGNAATDSRNVYTSYLGQLVAGGTSYLGDSGGGSSSGDKGYHAHNFSVSVGGTTNSTGDHSHSVTGNTDNEGQTATNKNLPPYYALCFIMKT